jgi:hypothetical protein
MLVLQSVDMEKDLINISEDIAFWRIVGRNGTGDITQEVSLSYFPVEEKEKIERAISFIKEQQKNGYSHAAVESSFEIGKKQKKRTILYKIALKADHASDSNLPQLVDQSSQKG